jgi:hypothetical protein
MNTFVKTIIPPFVLLVIPFIFSAISPCNPNFPGLCYGYTQQSYIDSLVQTAFYGFNEAAAAPLGREEKQRAAIKSAKELARKLRQLAVGDPNEKYILWRENELEEQIYLEENDIKLQGANQNARAVNELIGPFNDALNQKRPDFKRLQKFWVRMQPVSEDKASEMEVAIYNRKQIISRNVIDVFERALEDNNSSLARSELVYCADNQGLLTISLTQYSQMAAKLAARTSVSDEQAFIAASLKKAEELLKVNRIGQASELLHVAQSRLVPVKESMIRQEWDKLDARAHTLLERVGNKEDSLVKRDLAILSSAGIQAAGDFLDSVVSPQVADRNKVAYVNDEIMTVVMAKRSRESSPLSAEIKALTSASDDTASALDDVAAMARVRSRARADSSRMASRELGRITQPEEIRRERMQLASEGMRQREEKAQKNREALPRTDELRQDRMKLTQEGVQKRRDDALRLKQERANQSLVEIYTLLEQKKSADALRRFKQDRVLLKEQLQPADYDTLAQRLTPR